MASTLPPDRPSGPISSTGADSTNTPETDNGADVQPQTPKGSPSFQPSGLSERTVEQSENIHPQMKSGEELAAQSKEKLQELLNDSRLSNSYRRQAESKQIDSVKGLLNDVSGAIDWYSGNAAENFRSVVSEMMASNPKLEKLSVVMNIPPHGDVHLVPPGDDLERCEGDLQQILNIAKQMADGLGVKKQAEITDNDDKRVMEEGEQSFESILKHLDPDSRQDAFNQFRAFQNPRVEIGVNWSDLSNNSAWQPPDLSRCPPHLKPKEAEFDLTSEPDFEAPFVDERLEQLQAHYRSEALKEGRDLTESQLAAMEANIGGMEKTAKELMHAEQHIPNMFMFNPDEGLQSPKHQDNGDPSSTRAPAKKRGPESSEEMARREDLGRSGKKPRTGDEEYERTLDHSRLRREVEDDDVFDPNLTYTPNRRGRLSRSSGDDDTPKSPVFRPLPPPGGRDDHYFRFPSDVEGDLASAIRTRRPSGPYETSLPLDEDHQRTAREDQARHDDRGPSSSSTTPRSSTSTVDRDWELISETFGEHSDPFDSIQLERRTASTEMTAEEMPPVTSPQLKQVEVRSDGACLMRAALAHFTHEKKWLNEASKDDILEAMSANKVDVVVKQAIKNAVIRQRSMLEEAGAAEKAEGPRWDVYYELGAQKIDKMANDIYEKTIASTHFNLWSYQGLASALNLGSKVDEEEGGPIIKEHLNTLADDISNGMLNGMGIKLSDGKSIPGIKPEGEHYSLYVGDDFFE